MKEAQVQAKEQLANGEIGQEQYDALQREIIETEQQLKKLEDEFRQFGSVGVQQAAAVGAKMEEIGDKISDAGEKITDFGEGLTKTVTAGIAAVGTASVAAFREIDDGYDTVISKTGAAGEALGDLKEQVNDLYGSMNVSIDDASEAVGELNTRFGLTGDTCEEVARAFLEYCLPFWM